MERTTTETEYTTAGQPVLQEATALDSPEAKIPQDVNTNLQDGTTSNQFREISVNAEAGRNSTAFVSDVVTRQPKVFNAAGKLNRHNFRFCNANEGEINSFIGNEKYAPKKTSNESYTEILLKIQNQNNIINSIKAKIKEKSSKLPKTIRQKNEICNLKVCVQKEHRKLQTFFKKAMSIRQKDPTRQWAAIELATTYTEDCMPIQLNVHTPLDNCVDVENSVSSWKCAFTSGETSSEISSSELPYSNYFKNLAPSKRGAYQHVPRSQDPLFLQLQPKNRRGHSLDPRSRLLPHYVGLSLSETDGEQGNLRAPIYRKLPKATIIDCIQQKIDKIQKELSIVDNKEPESESSQKRQCIRKKSKKDKLFTNRSASDLIDIITRIQNELACDNKEKEGESTADSDSLEKLCLKKCECNQNNQEKDKSVPDVTNFRDKYYELLQDFRKKDDEVSKLKAIVTSLKKEKEVRNTRKSEGADNAEVRLLKEKVRKYEQDSNDFKTLISEQARQIDGYRIKYIATLQKVEEQNYLLQKLELNNRQVEDQINLEIKRIESTFQHQLAEYMEFPKLLENEQLKLAESCRQNGDLEMKLRVVCREFRALKAATNGQWRQSDEDPERSKKLSDELFNLRQQYDALKESRDHLSEQYASTSCELNTLRSESAKIIVYLKERASMNQTTMQNHIDELERDLAKCRAAACISLGDRDAVIKDTQSQLNCLAISFNAAHKQIKSLKDHIAYLLNGKVKAGLICCESSKG